MPTTFLPDVPWGDKPLPVAPRDTLNRSANWQSQFTFAAENSPLRIIYGQVRLGPLVANVLTYGGNFLILAVWGHGEIDSFVEDWVDDVKHAVFTTVTPQPSGGKRRFLDDGYSYVTHYVGTQTQTVDLDLVAAFNQQVPAVAFTDAMAGVAYSVYVLKPSIASAFPRINAIIKGLKVWNGTTTAWTDNPAYCLADFITNSAYGCKRTVNWASVASVAADCDELVGTAPSQEKRRTLHLSLDNVQSVSAWIDVLRTYAGCWVIPSGADLKLVSDKAGPSVATLDHAAGQIKSIGTIHKRGVQSTPTVMTVYYTNTTVIPWKRDSVTVYAPGVLDGTTPRRESSVDMQGINRYSQAVREATERLNKLLLNDLSFPLQVFDGELERDVGDILTVTHPIGLSAKQMRVLGIKGEYGRFELALSEYDPLVYDPSVATAPTYADTNLPNPMATLAAPTGLTTAEEVTKALDGTIGSRLVIGWTAPSDYYALRYFVSIWDATHEVASGYTAGTTYAHGPLVDGTNYTIKVYAERVVTQVRSAVLSGTKAFVGNTQPPMNIPSITTSIATDGLVVGWTPIAGTDIAAYVVKIYTLVGAAYVLQESRSLPAVSVTGSATTQARLGFVAAASYKFEVLAQNTVGLQSTATTNALITISGPGTIASVAPIMQDAGSVLSWTFGSSLPGSFPIDYYKIVRGASFGAGVEVARSATAAAAWVDTSPGTTYWVAAFDKAGNAGTAVSNTSGFGTVVSAVANGGTGGTTAATARAALGAAASGNNSDIAQLTALVAGGFATSPNSYQPEWQAYNIAADGTSGYLILAKSIGAGGAVTSGTGLGTLLWQGHNGTVLISGAYINAYCGGTPVAGAAGTGYVPTGIDCCVMNGPANTHAWRVQPDGKFLYMAGGGYELGFREVPQNSQVVNYTLVLSDSGKHIYHPPTDTSGRNVTIPANSAVAFPIGTTITIINDNATYAVWVYITTDTLVHQPSGLTGTRTLAPNSTATIVKVSATRWVITGNAVT